MNVDEVEIYRQALIAKYNQIIRIYALTRSGSTAILKPGRVCTEQNCTKLSIAVLSSSGMKMQRHVHCYQQLLGASSASLLVRPSQIEAFYLLAIR